MPDSEQRSSYSLLTCRESAALVGRRSQLSYIPSYSFCDDKGFGLDHVVCGKFAFECMHDQLTFDTAFDHEYRSNAMNAARSIALSFVRITIWPAPAARYWCMPAMGACCVIFGSEITVGEGGLRAYNPPP